MVTERLSKESYRSDEQAIITEFRGHIVERLSPIEPALPKEEKRKEKQGFLKERKTVN